MLVIDNYVFIAVDVDGDVIAIEGPGTEQQAMDAARCFFSNCLGGTLDVEWFVQGTAELPCERKLHIKQITKFS